MTMREFNLRHDKILQHAGRACRLAFDRQRACEHGIERVR